jgi:hypothetical protein
MHQKPISVRPARAVQRTLSFPSPNRPSPTWDRVPDVVKPRVVEALADVLLQASGAPAAHAEAGDD